VPPRIKISYCAVWAALLSAEGKEWRQRYEKNQRQPPGPSALLASDGLRLMMTVLEHAKSSDPKVLREQLPKITEFESTVGTVKWAEGKVVRPLFVVEFQGGKSRLVETGTGEQK